MQFLSLSNSRRSARSVRCWLAALLGVLMWGSAVRAVAVAPRVPLVPPAEVGMSPRRLAQIDVVVHEALEAGKMPGCVVAVGRRGKLAYLQAFGHRQLVPDQETMTTDTVFDLASLTKPIATSTSVMQLIDRGMLRLSDRVAQHVPEFASHGKDRITVFQLLTHQSGLIADNALDDYLAGPEKAWERIVDLELRAEPGTRFIYSDVGFIVLAELVQRLTGQRIDEFARVHLFEPLRMTDTGYHPSDEQRQRAAVTQEREGRWMRGEVHDPRAYYLGGVAGHAGLFSTAEDLAVFAQMLLDGGVANGAEVLSTRAISIMTADYPVRGGVRGLGWDKRTGYSSNRGEWFSLRAFGHGGFTGTSLWIDPELDLFVIFLSNRVHPDGQGAVNPLAGRIGTLAAAAIDERSRATGDERREALAPLPDDAEHRVASEVLCGIDVLERDHFALLQGKRVGLITNQTGINRHGVSTARLLHEAPGVELVTLFSPEHGIEGKLDVPQIADDDHAETGVRIVSLYGQTRRPTTDHLQGIDTLVFDIQDIGTRFYTYISTLGYAMEAAAEANVAVVVLDRPNPINGTEVAGPVLDEGRESFVGYHAIPVRHGMTVGELAQLFRHERDLTLDLTVVRVEGWRRSDFFDRTGLLWVNPSPNMRNLTQALLYPGIGLLETTNLSVGRGTDTPFEVVGAPWMDSRPFAAALNAASLPAVRFVPIRFTPASSKFAGEECGGVFIIITDRDRFDPLATGWEVARQLRLLYPDTWNIAAYNGLLGDQAVWTKLDQGGTREELAELYRDELREFMVRRLPWLLYGEESR